jgi:hypothetical protein
VTHVEQAERDAHGRWRRGSGNPAGRPRGAKNRHPRRRAGDRGREAEWTEHDWRVFYQRSFQEALQCGADVETIRRVLVP